MNFKLSKKSVLCWRPCSSPPQELLGPEGCGCKVDTSEMHYLGSIRTSQGNKINMTLWKVKKKMVATKERSFGFA